MYIYICTTVFVGILYVVELTACPSQSIILVQLHHLVDTWTSPPLEITCVRFVCFRFVSRAKCTYSSTWTSRRVGQTRSRTPWTSPPSANAASHSHSPIGTDDMTCNAPASSCIIYVPSVQKNDFHLHMLSFDHSSRCSVDYLLLRRITNEQFALYVHSMEDFYPSKNHGPDSGIGSDNGDKRLSTTEVRVQHDIGW